MRYSFEFKMKCVELYRQGIWAETPEKVMKRSFQRKILDWDKIEKIQTKICTLIRPDFIKGYEKKRLETEHWTEAT